MTTTIIRHESMNETTFAVVISLLMVGVPDKFLFQVYSIHGDFSATVLEETESWGTEAGAIEAFETWIHENTNVLGDYVGSYVRTQL